MNANFMNMDFTDVKSMSERNFGKIIHWVWERNFGDHLIIPVAQFIVPLAVTFSPLVLAFRASYTVAVAPVAPVAPPPAIVASLAAAFPNVPVAVVTAVVTTAAAMVAVPPALAPAPMVAVPPALAPAPPAIVASLAAAFPNVPADMFTAAVALVTAVPAAIAATVSAEQQYMAPGKQLLFWSVLIGGITNINILFSSLAGSCITVFTYNGRKVDKLSGIVNLLDTIANHLGSPYLSLIAFSKSIVELGAPLTSLLRAYYISTIISMGKSNNDSNDANKQADVKVDDLISKIFDFSTDKLNNMLYAFVELHIKLISYSVVQLGKGIDKGALNTMPQYFGCEILDYIEEHEENVNIEALGLLAYICDYLENGVSMPTAQVDISEETENKVEEVVSVAAESSLESCIVNEENIIQSSSAESDIATLSGNNNIHTADNEL